MFENKVLRKIAGTVRKNGVWKKRYNQELVYLYIRPDILSKIRT